MATENLKRLSLKLLATPLAEDGRVYLAGEDYQATTVLLPHDLRDEVNALVEEVLRIVPNDFSVSLSFATDGVHLSTEFEDGNTGSFGPGSRFTSRKSMFQKLRATNWDAKRADLMEQGSIFEDMLNEAEDRPPNIPLSRDAAQRYAPDLDAIVGEITGRGDPAPFVLVIVRDDKIEVTEPKTRFALIGDLGDVLATSYEVLAIVENGVKWSFEAIEAVKLEAIEGLGPISRAKAERRFDLA
ncbi:hypothetical protein [Horticoccus sp. 23ND18S-11]|uniref:hypothetical protein n=1 Tax=Horticoccus sp. 23ND18S-11 TaxID=3391832 RepID=UPI0039C9F866